MRVTGPDQAPLAKAKIQASVWTKEPFQHNRFYTCDADGWTMVELPQTFDIVRLWASCAKHVPLFVNWDASSTPSVDSLPEEFTFQMERGSLIGGTVTDEGGKPIANVRVQVALAGRRDGSESGHAVNDTWLAYGIAARVTNAEGRWELGDVPARDDIELRLMFTHRDYSSDLEWGSLQKQQGVTMSELRDQTANVAMLRGISLAGTVTDAAGKPLAKALVVWGDDPYQQEGRQEVRTDDRGRFSLPPLQPGPLTVTVVAEGWAPDLRKVEITRENPTVDFQLARGAKLRFAFVDANGEPIPRVAIGITEWRGGKSLYNHRHPNVLDSKIPYQSDKDGIFEWTWAPNDGVSYQFYRDDNSSIESQVFVADDEEHVITLP